MTTDRILNDRARTYGRFIDVATVATSIRNLLLDEAAKRKKALAPDQEEAFTMMASKFARLLVGDVNHVDSWRDLAGYAALVADRLEGRAR